jgi:hypothetical protein
MYLVRLIRFKLAWWRWFLTPSYKYGDRALGTGEVRANNCNLLRQRHMSKEPKPEHFGL